MKRFPWKSFGIFLLGMLTLAVGLISVNVFFGLRRPTPEGIIEDWGSICFWYSDDGSMRSSISPRGCFSTTCTRQISQVGTALIEQDAFKIHLDSTFVLAETSRFPLPCTENCSGGGSIDFNLGVLQVGKYDVWFEDEPVGNLNIFSGLPTPRQCFDNQ
ncbi:MAG: hypothetical protein JSV42_17820 [Chloroflexota bacterium]|nr:MAG: hypothetical protein JSV42_17820 [Chloroflexota bacterium]